MRPLLLAALTACGPAPQRVTMVPRVLIAEPVGLVPPRAWAKQAPELAGFWPDVPVLSLRQSWTATSTCREATYAGDERRSRNPRFLELVARLNGTPESTSAEWQSGNTRLFLGIHRERLGHMGSGGLTEPLTQVRACLDGVAHLDARALLASHPMLAPLDALVARSALRFHTAQDERSARWGRRVQLTFVATPAAQRDFARALIDEGFARPSAHAWAVESVTPDRSFVFYPPDREENLVTVSSASL